MADTALKTADAGYLTRRLVDVAQDVTIFMRRLWYNSRGCCLWKILKEGEEIIEPLEERILEDILLKMLLIQ